MYLSQSEPYTLVERDRKCVQGSRTFNTDMDAAKYREWVIDNLGSLFVNRREAGGELVFSTPPAYVADKADICQRAA